MQKFKHVGTLLTLLVLPFSSELTQAAELTLKTEKRVQPDVLQISEDSDSIIVQLKTDQANPPSLNTFFLDDAAQAQFLGVLNQRLDEQFNQKKQVGIVLPTLDATVDTALDSDNDTSFLQMPAGIGLTLKSASRTDSPLLGSTRLRGDSDDGLQAADDLLSNADSQYVVMYAMSGAPLLQSLDVPKEDLYKPANIIRYLGAGEPVAVFDNAPRWVETEGGGMDGKNIYVWAMGGGISQVPGYVPLFFLASNNPGNANGTIELDVPYNLLSRLATESIQDIFYKDCYSLHPETGDVGKQADTAPFGKNYYCGQYPFGNTAQQAVIHGDYFRHVTTVSKTLAEVDWQPDGPLSLPHIHIWDEDPEGTVFDAYNPQLYVNVPVYVSNRQLRSSGSLLLNTLTNDTVSGVELSANQTYSFGNAADEDNARVHPMDIAIRHYYDTDQANADAVQVEIQLNLPGIEICQPWTPKEIVLEYRGLLGAYYEARTQQFTLGCVSIGSLPLRIHAEIALEAPAPGLDGLISNDGYQVQKGLHFKSVQFVQAPSVAISAPVGVKFAKNEFPDAIQAAAEMLLNNLNTLVQINTGNGSNLGGTLLWSQAGNKVAEVLLDQLENLGDKLSGPMRHPREIVLEDCNRLFPAAYQNPSNAFYPLYKLCRTSAMSLALPTFINPTDKSVTSQGSYRELTDVVFAPINLAGLPWASASSASKSYFCADGSLDCYVNYERPWYSRFDPKYVLTGADKFNPYHYQYQKGSGVSIGIKASGAVSKPLWNLMRCLTPKANTSMAYHPEQTLSWHRQQLQNGCFTEALGAMCQLYGSAPALTSMWTEKYGITPKLGGYANYCDWYEEEQNHDDIPDWQGSVATQN